MNDHTGVAQSGRASGQINRKVRRFESPPPYHFKIRWAEELKCQLPNGSGVYNRRWYLETAFFSIRLHHWMHSDDVRAPHDHPWWFVTFVLSGGYLDLSPSGDCRMARWSWAFRPAHHQHSVKVDPGGCWTILLTGPKSRFWGFWVQEKFVKANKYFLRFGPHHCD
jgi:hypothetical protein